MVQAAEWFAGARDGVWDWDLQTNAVFFSSQWKRIIGYDDSELEDAYESWRGHLHPDDLDRTLSVLNDYLEGRRSIYEVEFRLRHKDGSYRWILARGAALRDTDGRPSRMAGSHTDVTARKEAEAQLRASHEKFESLVNSIHGIVWEAERPST